MSLDAAAREVEKARGKLKELKDNDFGGEYAKPKIHCRVFKDNTGALALATVPKVRPRTKHIAIKYHHFREHVANKKISIHAIDTKEQIADQFTKALQQGVFEYLRYKLLGW